MNVAATADDIRLIERSALGDRNAFGELVRRYQSLVCSVTYGITGSLSRSEDLAQETFLNAWQQLGSLREPDKLKAWLCGIARNLARNGRRQASAEPIERAAPVELAGDVHAATAAPAEQAISDEEQAILWRSLERIPENYREALVLFYRESHSVAEVAVALDVSEEIVRQRLSRGRKLLHAEVVEFVERALVRSAPGKAFAVGVVAALPNLSTSASAAVIGTTATKGGVLVKWASFAAVFNAALGFLLGLAGTYFGYRLCAETTRTPRERERLRRQMRNVALGLAFFLPALLAFTFAGSFWAEHRSLFLGLAIALPSTFAIWIVGTVLTSTRAITALRETERAAHPELFLDGHTPAGGFSEYRSKLSLFGLPLLHVQFGVPPRGAAPARGWVAIGPAHAWGVVYAMGATSCGGISVGAISAGIVSIGSVSVGLVSLATIAFGILAFGGIAIGDFAIGGFSVAWTAAAGGLALANGVAGGGYALAAHANDAFARAFLEQYRFDLFLQAGLAAIVVLLGVPGVLYLLAVRRRRVPM